MEIRHRNPARGPGYSQHTQQDLTPPPLFGQLTDHTNILMCNSQRVRVRLYKSYLSLNSEYNCAYTDALVCCLPIFLIVCT